MVALLLEWLHQYGYPIVLVVAVLENLFPVGFVTPGEVIILTAAATAGAASLDPVLVAVMAATGETLGQVASYAIGRYAGNRAVVPLCRRYPGICTQIENAQAYFRKRGAVALLVGRPVWGIKSVLPVVAGMSGMSWWKALGLVTLSSLYYYPTLVAVAYLFGLGVGEVAGVARGIGIIFGTIIAVLVAGALLRARHARQGDT